MNTKRKLLLGLASLAAIPLAATRRAQAATDKGGNDDLAAIRKRLQHLEDMDGIRKLQAKYVHYLFTQRFDRIFPECFAQKRDDISAEFSDSGVYKGPEHVKALYAAFDATKKIPGFFIMHMMVDPYIEIAQDGMSAKSHWMSPGITNNRHRSGWVFGPYYVDYVKEDGEWRLLHNVFAPIVRTDFNTPWGEAEDNGSVRTLGIEPDAPPTIYRPFAEVRDEQDIFRNHPRLPEPY